MKLSALALALGITFSGSAFATSNVWNIGAPWGSSTTAQYAEWNAFNADADGFPVLDTTPNVSLSSGTTASIEETSGGASGAFIIGGVEGNIYSNSAATTFTATLSGTTSGFYDVYLRLGTLGSPASFTATLNNLPAQASVTTIGASAGGGSEQELFWKWSGVAGSSLYTFKFNASTSSMSLDQLALATVAVAAPVPEPESYGMMALGLGLVAFARRRASNKNKV